MRETYFISHSGAGAFAAGMTKYFVEQNGHIGESIMIAADERNEFSIDENKAYVCYSEKEN